MQNSQEVQRYSGDYYVVQNPVPMQTAAQPVPSDSTVSQIDAAAAAAPNHRPPTHRGSSRSGSRDTSGDRVVSIENRPASVGSAHLGKLQILVRGVIP